MYYGFIRKNRTPYRGGQGSRIVSGVFAICLGVSALTLTGCADNKTKAIPNTPEGQKTFRADPSKMPPEARKRMEEAMKAGAMNPRDRGENPAPKPAN